MSPLSPRRRSRIAHFKAPFIISVAAPAAFGLACGGRTDSGDGEGSGGERSGGSVPGTSLPNEGSPVTVGPAVLPSSSGTCSGVAMPPYSSCSAPPVCIDGHWVTSVVSCNPPAPDQACPAVEPELGTSCAAHPGGLTCAYDHCYEVVATRQCNANTALWEAMPLPTCNPPPPSACPETIPVPGSDCLLEGDECRYPGCEGEASSSAVCRFGQWAVVYSTGEACNPPAVVPVCPTRSLAAGEGCWYEGQQCSPESCDGVDSRPGLVCTGAKWQDAVLLCPSGEASADAGI